MLTGSCLGDHLFLSHTFCKQDLSDDIVDLVCTGMIQILALQINPCTVFLGQILRKIKRCLTPYILF